MIGVSAQMQRVYSLVHQSGSFTYPALIVGEKGTGKKLAAETIHSLSQRKEKAFIVADCANLPPTLVESELFGYEKGAFSGARQTQWGLLAFAREGTILLKEVGDLPLHVQGRIVQMLDEKEFRAIGSTQPLPFKSRVLATSSRDLRCEVERKNFREDLFVRLSATQIALPPLHERKEDIPLLIDYFLETYQAANAPAQRFSADAIEHLCQQEWRGNVRELQEVVRRTASATSGPVIEVNDLRLRVELPDDRRWADNLTSYLDQRERQAIMEALRESDGDTTSAAKLLGMAEAALQKRLQYYNL
jgi:two-component system response regulator AtoC